MSENPTSQSAKLQRVLACVRCQQRKVKCDRSFPCLNCRSSQAQCVPATVTTRSQRRRRFPERELLDRLRTYEELLRQNDIEFEPLHASGVPTRQGNKQDSNSPQDLHSNERKVDRKQIYQAKYAHYRISPYQAC